MRRFATPLAVSLLLAATPSAFAHYYGWIPGSSTDTPESGNRMAIVNLHTGGVTTPTNGFQFTTESAGADPLPPTFSPDGVYAYVTVGGTENAGESRNGFVYVFQANNVHHLLEASQPAPAALQKITIIAGNANDAVEPSGITMSPAFNKVIVTDTQYEKVYIWDVVTSGANVGTLNEGSRTTLNAVSAPTSAWINKAGTRAYYCTNQESSDGSVTTQPKIHVIDLTLFTPAEIASVDVPSPTQGSGVSGIKTVPVATCTFVLKLGAQMTVAQPPGLPDDTIFSDSFVYIFSGYAGFSGKAFGTPVVLNDAFTIYKLDTTTNFLVNNADMPKTITPTSTQVTFPPFLSLYHSAHNSTLFQAAGTFRFEEGGTVKTLTPSSTDYILLNGMLEPKGDVFYFGSISGADITTLALTGNYAPLQTSSNLYSQSGHSIINATVSPMTNGVTQRSLTTVVGFSPYIKEHAAPVEDTLEHDVVLASSDGFFGFNVPSSEDVAVSRKTQIVIYDPVNSTQKATIPLNLVAGAYTQQPIGAIPIGSSGLLQIADHLLGKIKLGVGGDVDHNRIIDAEDLVKMYAAPD